MGYDDVLFSSSFGHSFLHFIEVVSEDLGPFASYKLFVYGLRYTYVYTYV